MMAKTSAYTLYTFLEKLKLRYVVGFSLFTIVGAAEMYHVLTLFDLGGLKQSNGTVDWWDSLYFSVVTFTSLGYGDITPVGPARFVACVEVMLGLALFGLAVAKVSAVRQSYYLSRLYVSDATERLGHYEQSLRDLKLSYRQTTPALTERVAFESLNIRLHGILHSLSAYVSFETSKGDFFGEISPFPVVKMLRQMAKTLREVQKLRQRCTLGEIKLEAVDVARRRIEQAREAVALINASSANEEIREACTVVDRVCGSALG